MPGDQEQLTSFYEGAGYTFPTSTARMYLTTPRRPFCFGSLAPS